MSVMTAV